MGVEQDYTEGAKWLRKAADQGNASAQTTLASWYFAGAGVPEDHYEAARLALTAAKSGEHLGQALIGTYYFLGAGVPQDYAESYFWLNLSSIDGNKDSIELRNQAKKQLNRETIIKIQERTRNYMETLKTSEE